MFRTKKGPGNPIHEWTEMACRGFSKKARRDYRKARQDVKDYKAGKHLYANQDEGWDRQEQLNHDDGFLSYSHARRHHAKEDVEGFSIIPWMNEAPVVELPRAREHFPRPNPPAIRGSSPPQYATQDPHRSGSVTSGDWHRSSGSPRDLQEPRLPSSLLERVPTSSSAHGSPESRNPPSQQQRLQNHPSGSLISSSSHKFRVQDPRPSLPERARSSGRFSRRRSPSQPSVREHPAVAGGLSRYPASEASNTSTLRVPTEYANLGDNSRTYIQGMEAVEGGDEDQRPSRRSSRY